MKKKWVRMMCGFLTVVMCVGLAGCGAEENKDSQQPGNGQVQEDGENQDPSEPFIIGVCEYQANDESVVRKDYFENYLGPAYNVEFIFSEPITDTESELTFIENIVQAGADAYISFRSESTNQLAQVCEEYGLYYCVNSNRNDTIDDAFKQNYKYFTGCFSADQPRTGEIFSDWLNEEATDTGEEGFMVASGLAFQGNVQHYECTMAILNALQEKYDLTYEDTAENLAITSAPLEVANDKGIEIYIYPGSITSETWLPGVSAGLQTGKYGVFLQAVPSFSQTAVVVDEVERTYNKNIKVASIASISETTENAFHTEDSFGNPSLDLGVAKSTTVLSVGAFIKMYNALTGYEKLNIGENGEPTELLFLLWGIASPEEMDAVATWDAVGGDNWVIDTNIIDQCLGINNPDLTAKEIQDILYEIDLEEAKERMAE